ncbi:TPA_asm: hypothetical protein G1Q02_17495 [Salmonella enterica subsp. enterica serovar Typhimurium]|nr:hypothetical protein [Salmonella enterica subsp. enterica serovar Typhimurium]
MFGMILAGAGAALSLLSSHQASKGATQAGEDQSTAYLATAQMNDADAVDALAASYIKAAKIRRAGEQAMSTARTAYAASGVEVDTGTALNVTSGIAGDAEEDAVWTILNGESTAAHLRRQAAVNRIAAVNARKAGHINSQAATLGGIGSLLGGASQIMGMLGK